MLFIVNPTSARGLTARTWQSARRELDRRGIVYREHLTAASGEATRVAGEALRAGERRIIAVGGDGTLSEVMAGYFLHHGQTLDPRAEIGLLPSGTGSDFCRTLGWRNWTDALTSICAGRSRPIDVGRIEIQTRSGEVKERYFINVASFGLGGEVVARVNAWRSTWPRWIGGRTRFVAAALLALKDNKYRRVRVEADDGRVWEMTSNFLVVGNGRFAGSGMMFAPDALIDDGQLDLILTDELGAWGIIRELPRIGRGGHLRNRCVTAARCRQLSITSDRPLAVDLDGEAAGLTPARLTILPGALRFIG